MTAGTDTLELLATFVRIVETGTLSAAAVDLGTTQPTVSRRLSQLEHALGVRLLRRTTHAMKLTEDGERCLAHARAVLERWHVAEADLRGLTESPHGVLRVVAPTLFGQEQLLPPVLDLLAAHPGLEVEWLLRDRLPDFVADGIDCAIHLGPMDERDLVAVRLAELPRVLVAAPSLLGGGPVPQSPEALERLPWLALAPFYRDAVELVHAKTGAQARIAIRPRFLTDNLRAAKNAALAGVGVALLSTWIVTDAIKAGALVTLAPRWTAPSLPLSLVFPERRLRPARVRAFTDAMQRFLPTVQGVKAPRPARVARR